MLAYGTSGGVGLPRLCYDIETNIGEMKKGYRLWRQFKVRADTDAKMNRWG